MPSSFPGAIDSFTDPLSTSPLSSPSHALQHQNINDAVEKVEQYMGLVKVIPTSATNGTVGATGTVTIGNAVSSVTVNGAFSSLYDNYRVVLNGVSGTSAGTILYIRFDAGGTTNYYGSLYYDAYTGTDTSTSRRNAQASTGIGLIGTAENSSLSSDIYAPFLAKRTFFTSSFFAQTYSGWAAGTDDSQTSKTTFTLLVLSGTITGGTIRVYGYRN